jgi:hypothetical protein
MTIEELWKMQDNSARETNILYERKQLSAQQNGIVVEQVKKETVTNLVTNLVVGAVGVTVVIILFIRLIK